MKNKLPVQRKNTKNKLLKIALVGGGDIGLRNAESASSAPSVKVAAVYDENLDVCRQMARQLSVQPAANYEDILDRNDIDAVFLSIPHYLHVPLGVAAAKAGKHVIMEKPLGIDLKTATELLNVCNDHKVRLTVNFSFRFKPTIQLARNLIKDGIIGEVAGVQVMHLMFKYAGYWEGGYSARSPNCWRGTLKKAGGGILIMGITHTIDYLSYITGLDVKRAFAEYGTFATPAEVEDAISVSLKYSNGAVGSIVGSTCWRGKPIREDHIWGTEGLLILRAESIEFWSAKRWHNKSAGHTHIIKKLPKIDYTCEWVERFANAVLTEKPHDIPGEDGWINNAIIEAAYLSNKVGQSIEIEKLQF